MREIHSLTEATQSFLICISRLPTFQAIIFVQEVPSSIVTPPDSSHLHLLPPHMTPCAALCCCCCCSGHVRTGRPKGCIVTLTHVRHRSPLVGSTIQPRVKSAGRRLITSTPVVISSRHAIICLSTPALEFSCVFT